MTALLELGRRARQKVRSEFAAPAIWRGCQYLFENGGVVPDDIIATNRRPIRFQETQRRVAEP